MDLGSTQQCVSSRLAQPYISSISDKEKHEMQIKEQIQVVLICSIAVAIFACFSKSLKTP